MTFCIERVHSKPSMAGLGPLSMVLLYKLHAEHAGPKADVCASCNGQEHRSGWVIQKLEIVFRTQMKLPFHLQHGEQL